MTRPLTREESKLITRRRLLEAGAKLLAEHGYGALSASAIAREAGIAQPTFYVHFSDKDDLIRTLARERLGAVRRPLREARLRVARGQGLAALRDTFRVPLEALLTHPELFRLLIQELHSPASPFAKHARELQDELESDLIDDLVSAGAPAATAEQRQRSRMIAEGLISLTQTLGLGYLDGRYDDLDRIVDVLVHFALGAIGAIGAAEIADQR